MGFTALCSQVEPVALIDKTDGQKQCPQSHEAEDPVSLAQIAHIGDKNLCNRDAQKHQRLPAQEGRSPPEPCGQQDWTEEHKPRRVSELNVHKIVVLLMP